MLSIYQNIQNSGTHIPWREKTKPLVRALLIAPSYATGTRASSTISRIMKK